MNDRVGYIDTRNMQPVTIELTASDLYQLLIFKSGQIDELYRMKQTQIDNGLSTQAAAYQESIDKYLQEFELLKEKILIALN